MAKENLSAKEVKEAQEFKLQKYTHLAKFAKSYLSALPSSVCSVKLFSEAVYLYEQKRNRLIRKTGEKLLFLHHIFTKNKNTFFCSIMALI